MLAVVVENDLDRLEIVGAVDERLVVWSKENCRCRKEEELSRIDLAEEEEEDGGANENRVRGDAVDIVVVVLRSKNTIPK